MIYNFSLDLVKRAARSANKMIVSAAMSNGELRMIKAKKLTSKEFFFIDWSK